MNTPKRLFDIAFALVLGLILSPVFVAISLWILLREGGPIFYVSERMKTPDQAFQLIKFRTMTVVEEDSGVSGGDKAARVTPIGRVLRAKRLDELPQLWNILRGDISFVGPRPPLRQYVERFPDLYRAVLQARPGVTGLATLKFHRHEELLIAECETPQQTDEVYARRCVPRKAQLDLVYYEHQNLCFDVSILAQTLKSVIKQP